MAKHNCSTEDISNDYCPRLKKFQVHIGEKIQW